jgi:hypothetical protein
MKQKVNVLVHLCCEVTIYCLFRISTFMLRLLQFQRFRELPDLLLAVTLTHVVSQEQGLQVEV